MNDGNIDLALRETEIVDTPFISAVIPCRNEEKHIGPCLDSIIASDYPKDRLEVLVVDGMSDDKSRLIVEGYIRRYPYIRLLDNIKKTLAAAWNLGIKNGKGDVIVSMNAHATIEPEFLSQCVYFLQKYDADCVGPVIVTHPQDDALFGRAIAVAMSHPFGVGNSRFRIGTKEPRWVDTVHCSAYRREVFERIGVYNEELVRSQDIELHLRLRRAGGRILLVPEMTIHYFTRSNPSGFAKYGFLNGFWVTNPYQFGTVVAQARHLVPMVFVSYVVGSVALSFWWPVLRSVLMLVLTVYGAIALAVSVNTALKKRDVRFAVVLPVVFLTYHATYGLGSLVGLLRAFVSLRFWELLWGTSRTRICRGEH